MDRQILKTLFWQKKLLDPSLYFFTKKYILNRDRSMKAILNCKDFDQVWQTFRH